MDVSVKCEKHQRCKKGLGHFGVKEAKEKSISRSLEVNYASWMMKVNNNEGRKNLY